MAARVPRRNELKLLRASAGSGKTYALVHRYLELALVDPPQFRRILALTFTNKATAEMKRRIVATTAALAQGDHPMLMSLSAALPGVNLDRFVTAADRRTFTYCKPLLMHSGQPPEELNRLDSKNWTATPPALEQALIEHLKTACEIADAVIFLIQVDVPETGAITRRMLAEIGHLAAKYPDKPMLADSRQSLKGWPAVAFKMNAAERAAMLGRGETMSPEEAARACVDLAKATGRPVFVSMSEHGIVAAEPDGASAHVPALPLRGPIDIVGAGDSVTANLATALAAGAHLREALELAAAASSHVIHQLGTTGTASVDEIERLVLT